MTDRDQIIREAFDESIPASDTLARLRSHNPIPGDLWVDMEIEDTPGMVTLVPLLIAGGLGFTALVWGLAVIVSWVLT